MRNRMREFLHALVTVCHEPRRLAEFFAPDGQVKGKDTKIVHWSISDFKCACESPGEFVKMWIRIY